MGAASIERDEPRRAALAEPRPNDVPSVMDRSYVVHEKLGEGGMGAVFRATHRLTGRTVALKVIGDRGLRAPAADSDARKQLLLSIAREFQTLASLHHPNVIHVLDYGFDEETGPYFTMELLQSPRLIVAAGLGASLEGKVRLLAQLLRALSYLHRRGIIHRDVKPSNVLCVDGVVKVADFGLAIAAHHAVDVAGTVEYIAPEIWHGTPPSVQSDLYSVGVIMYELLTGRLPFSEQTQVAGAFSATVPIESADRAHLASPFAGYEGPFGEIVAKLLAREPSARYASALDALRDIGDAASIRLTLETAETRESFLQASELVGRDAELAELTFALASARDGRGGGFLIAGESGVGKSRLCAELRTRALVGRMCVVSGQAASEAGGSYQVWLPVLRALCLRAELADAEAAVLRELFPDLPELLGRPLPEPPRLPAAALRSRLREAIEALFRSQPRPTLVILEDLQWASEDSLELLAHVSTLAQSLPLLVVGNARDDEAADVPSRVPALRVLKLRRLDEAAVAKLAVSMLGERGGTPELTRYLCRQTEGNVFFLVEVVRALAEQAGQLDRITQIALPEDLLTGGIERIAQRRVDRVPEPDRDLLEQTATLGRHLDLRVLRHLAPDRDVERWLVTCANAAVLESQAGEWQFAHDKLREAILARMDAGRRAELHRRVARAVEAVYSGPRRDAKSALLAYHFREAGEHALAAEYGLRAGDYATRLCSYGEARAHYGKALAEIAASPPSDAARRLTVDVLLQQIYTTLVADSADQNFKRAVEARALLDEIGRSSGHTREDKLRLARVNYFHGRIHFYRGDTRQALEYYRQVLPAGEEAGDEELIALPSCLVGTAVLIQGNATAAEPLLARAIGPLERLGEPFEWFRAVGYHGLSLVALGRYAEGIAELERVCARAREIGQPSLLSAAHLMTGSTYLFSGDWPLVVEYLEKVIGFASQTGDNLHLSLAWSGIAWAQSALGRHAEAAACRARGRRIAEEMGGRLMLDDWYRASDADTALNAGEHDLALERAQSVAANAEAAGLLFSRGVAERVWGEVLAVRGEAAAADAHMAASVAAHASGGILVQVARTRVRWALQRARRGEETEAERLYDETRRDLARFGCAYAVAESERAWQRRSP